MDVARLLGPVVANFILDQDLLGVLQRQEIRITEGFLQREVMDSSEGDEVQSLKISFGSGSGTISGMFQKKPLPVAIPFSARFSLTGYRFEPEEKVLRLQVGEVKPFDMEWLTAKALSRIPFMRYEEGTAVLDLLRIPKLEQLFSSRVAGVRVFDHLTVRELKLQAGELVLRVGVRDI